MRMVAHWVAFDGKQFDTAEACKAYESTNLPASLVSLLMPPGEEIADEDVIARINKALTREDRPLADVLEKVGSEITKKRLADGEKRRNVGSKPTAPPAADPAPASTEANLQPEAAAGEPPPPPPAIERGFGRAGTEG